MGDGFHRRFKHDIGSHKRKLHYCCAKLKHHLLGTQGRHRTMLQHYRRRSANNYGQHGSNGSDRHNGDYNPLQRKQHDAHRQWRHRRLGLQL